MTKNTTGWAFPDWNTHWFNYTGPVIAISLFGEVFYGTATGNVRVDLDHPLMEINTGPDVKGLKYIQPKYVWPRRTDENHKK